MVLPPDTKPVSTIFVDLDDTLITTILGIHFAVHPQNYAYPRAETSNGTSILRPYATRFLTECRKIAPTYIFSAGSKSWIEEIFDHFSLHFYIDGYYSLTDVKWSEFPVGATLAHDFSLLEDRAFEDPIVQAKLSSILRRTIIDDDRIFVKNVSPFDGNNASNALLQLLIDKRWLISKDLLRRSMRKTR